MLLLFSDSMSVLFLYPIVMELSWSFYVFQKFSSYFFNFQIRLTIRYSF